MTEPARTVLVTGFEPFERDPLNPSREVARALHGWRSGDWTVASAELPCVFGRAAERLHEAITAHRPALVVALGQAGGRADVTPERVAINVDDARIADNAGAQPIDAAVVPGAPAAYWATLPVKAIVQALRAAGLPASVSNSAGTFVCNHVFYALMHRLATDPALAGARGGFVHLPWLPEQAARQSAAAPSMALATQLDAVRVLIGAALAHRADLPLAGGALH